MRTTLKPKQNESKETKESASIPAGLGRPNASAFDAHWKSRGVDQDQWTELWSEVVLEGCKRLKAKDPVCSTARTFFVNFLGQERARVGEILGHDKKTGVTQPCYGISRTQDLQEDCPNFYSEILEPTVGRYSDQYIPLKNRLLALHSSKSNNKFYRGQQESGVYKAATWAKKEESRKYHLTSITIDGNFIDTKGQTYRQSYIENALVYLEGNYHRSYYASDTDTEYMVTLKMSSDKLDDFWRAVEPHYQAVLNWNGNDEKEFYYKLGILAWHTGVAMPLRLGSTAVNEAMIRALILAKGFKKVEFKKGITPDFRAYFTSDPEEFAKNFYNLFEGTPEFKDAFDTMPTQEAKKADAHWEGVKQTELDSENNSLRYIGQHAPLVMFRDTSLPKNQRDPSKLRYCMEGFEINRNRVKEFKRRLALFAENRINKLENEIKDSPEKIALLKREGGFSAIYLYTDKDLFVDDTYDCIKRIKAFLLETSLERLEEIRLCYLHEEQIIEWIETLPNTQGKYIHELVGSRDKLKDFKLDNLKKLVDKLSVSTESKTDAATPYAAMQSAGALTFAPSTYQEEEAQQTSRLLGKQSEQHDPKSSWNCPCAIL